ncbi:hypothetical protein DCS_00298 [Drechmeria coniospora]|uniref:LYC1 C-terminal domain-containing protein n=1 Tax=Drechmeria coniospora TaxID=98403 RepID=A0A151GQ29_DRECN|nr:hypothetical protein DCS_00298 [Drechmeria coniospora]KYK59168.1 hypothetical protein DCS_00298 [Drechmeria coniospora]ODA77917.1 hypothetical protein RJ55_06520 [Drechmeria coniospora]
MSLTLTLDQPSADEQIRTWTRTHPAWGASYPLDKYLERERHLLDVPLARDGGITQWILTDPSLSHADDQRPVLSSCETLRKAAFVRGADGVVQRVWAHGVASVFTYPEFRSQGYARTMLELITQRLTREESELPGDAAFSILFSDIGKTYYAALGWKPYESAHLSLPVMATNTTTGDDSASRTALTLITDDNLPALAARDEELLHQKLSRPPHDPSKTRVAIIPDLDTFQWHFAREVHMCQHHFSRAPTVHGAIYTPPGGASDGQRVWAVWSSTQNGGKEKPEKNVMYILRFVVEDQRISDEELSVAFKNIVNVAKREAREWLCTSIDMWNPDERIKALVSGMADLQAKLVVRENDNIPSLRWLGDASASDIEWLANERFEWC